jgi:hypothetical protein
MSTAAIRAALEQWRDLAQTDLLCPANPAETDWGAVVVAIAATRAALAQPEAEGLTVNLQIDASPECFKRLCDGLAAAVKPNGGYKAATTDDPAPGTGCDQMVQVEWWIPQHGCDSLENTLDAIKGRLLVAVRDWWATALVQPEGEGPAAWMYLGEPYYDGRHWHDQWQVTLDERLARYKSDNKEPIPLWGRSTPQPIPVSERLPGEEPSK